MNHFYGWAMSDYLPYGEFKWLKNANNLDVNSISEKSPIGYIVEVGLNILVNYMYCKIIVHQLQKNIITNTMLVRILKKNAQECGIKVGDVMKLIPSLSNKTNYVLHYKNLQLYLGLEMKLTKIHKVLKSSSLTG